MLVGSADAPNTSVPPCFAGAAVVLEDPEGVFFDFELPQAAAIMATTISPITATLRARVVMGTPVVGTIWLVLYLASDPCPWTRSWPGDRALSLPISTDELESPWTAATRGDH